MLAFVKRAGEQPMSYTSHTVHRNFLHKIFGGPHVGCLMPHLGSLERTQKNEQLCYLLLFVNVNIWKVIINNHPCLSNFDENTTTCSHTIEWYTLMKLHISPPVCYIWIYANMCNYSTGDYTTTWLLSSLEPRYPPQSLLVLHACAAQTHPHTDSKHVQQSTWQPCMVPCIDTS